MKIKIVRSGLSTYWYANMIGTEHEVIKAVNFPDDDGRGFQVKYKHNGETSYVGVDDAEIVFEEL